MITCSKGREKCLFELNKLVSFVANMKFVTLSDMMCRILALDGCSGLRLTGGSLATMASADRQERRSHRTWRPGSTCRPQYTWRPYCTWRLGLRSLTTLVPGGQERSLTTLVPGGQEKRARWKEQQLRQGKAKRSRREAWRRGRETRGSPGSEKPG